MGIKNLTKLIADEAPDAIKEQDLKELTGRKVAIDASMAIYQFLVAVRSSGDGGGPSAMLTNEAGEVTSHLQGMFNRTIRMLESGIKPAYVFDGKPPEMKAGELAKRKAAKEKAEAEVKAAEEEGRTDDVERFSKRTVRMTKEHQEDCKTLLRLMGVPVIEAPCEAESTCAALAKAGHVYAAASEDMDTLTFDTPVLVRRLTFSDARKLPVLEFKLNKVLAGLGLDMAQFIDMCILCGCDYCDTIRGIGPKKALTLIKEHGTIEAVVAALDKTKFPVPENFLEQAAHARELFNAPEVLGTEDLSLRWVDCDEEALKKFLVEDKGFSPDRVARGIEKLRKAKGTASQSRMDSFFKFTAAPNAAAVATKRKAASKMASKGKKAKGAKGRAGAGRAAAGAGRR